MFENTAAKLIVLFVVATALIVSAELVRLILSIGVCGVRDVKLLLPDIFRKEFVPRRGVQAFRRVGRLNLLSHCSTCLAR